MFDGIDWQSGKDPATFQRKLSQFYDELNKRLKVAAKAITEIGVERAKQKAPVDTGELRDSISGKVEEMQSVVVMKIQVGAAHGVNDVPPSGLTAR